MATLACHVGSVITGIAAIVRIKRSAGALK